MARKQVKIKRKQAARRPKKLEEKLLPEGTLQCNVIPFNPGNHYAPEVFFDFEGHRYTLTKFGVRGATAEDMAKIESGSTAKVLLFRGILELHSVN